jgi:uncharacterized RDD family membrane protein YckC
MSSQIDLSAESWKQEVNRRVAAHKTRKGVGVAIEPPATPAESHHASSRAAAAAARVAARYAKAPSYSEALAEEARVAVRAASKAAQRAQEASEAARQAHATAVTVLAGLEEAAAQAAAQQGSTEDLPCPAARVVLEAAPVALPEPFVSARLEPSMAAEPEQVAPPAQSSTSAPQDYSVRWEPDFAERQQESSASAPLAESEPEFWSETADAAYQPESVEVVEPGRTIHANLIEFPRELVATRRVRPRLAEGPAAAEEEPGTQLSIFEVDPRSVSTLPAAEEPVANEAVPGWSEQDWSSFKLPAQSEEEEALLDESDYLLDRAPRIESAPIGLRLMVTLVNSALIVGAFLAVALVALVHASEMPTLHTLVVDAVGGLLLSGAVYLQMFYVLGKSTPGMKYAHLRLVTLDGDVPSRAQRLARLASVLFSILPLGLGLVWFLFDEDHLCWHDRLSRTYLRRY